MGTASTTTGAATGAGVVSSTRILQAALVRSEVGEDKQSVENTLVINLGQGTANTGLNKIIGVLSEHGEDYGIGGGGIGAAGTASVETGGATAVGVASSTLITQTVQAHATDGAFIVITQKGVVFNVGGAISNTGFNSATGVGGLDLTGDQLAALTALYQLLNALLEAGGWALPADGGAGGDPATPSATHTCRLEMRWPSERTRSRRSSRTANATADGGTIDASQSAVVANIGLGVANTGGNRAAGVTGGGPAQPEDSDEVQQSLASPAAQALADFLLALSGGAVAPDGTTEVAGLFDFGALVATLAGHAEVTDSLLDAAPTDLLEGDDSSGQQTTGVRVRQIIGVLTFAFSSANGNVEVESDADVKQRVVETDAEAMSSANQLVTSAQRHADQTVQGTSSSETESVGNPPDPATFVADVTGSAEIDTGDAVAGNVPRTRVCQVHNVDADICLPKVIRWIVNPGVGTFITRTTVRVQQVTVPKVAPTPTPSRVVVVPSGVRAAALVAEDDSVLGQTLPVTGADSDANLTIAWSLVGAGLFLVLVAALAPRRRATG